MFSIDIRVIQYFIRVFLLFGLYSLLRLLFLLFNWDLFDDVRLWDFIAGMRYDGVSIVLWFIPFHVLSLLGIWWNNTILQKTTEFFLLLGIVLSILLTTIDFRYYEFTLKRTTSDVLMFFGEGGDIWALLPQFLMDFWYLFFLAALLIYGCIQFFRTTYTMNSKNFNTGKWPLNVFFSMVIVGGFVLLGRGGIQLVPLKTIDAAKHTKPQNVPIVLNTPFTLIKTFGKSSMAPVAYFSKEELSSIFNPVHEPIIQDASSFKKLNVVVIVLESFSNEFVRSDRKEYLTPYFNSLKKQSLSFENCFANGKKSIEGIPSIFSGIPTLSDHPLITGLYGGNKLNSLATYLKREGYATSFFHGGRNGTMNFDSYTNATDFDNYYGLDEYPNQEDFDGTWGVYDEEFFSFFNEELKGFTPPFFSGIFSLSSHHPYTIPERHQSRFNKGKRPMENAIAYADYALRTFFEKAKTTTWYKNTLFVITADHTPNTKDKEYSLNVGQYSVPLLFYMPGDTQLIGSNTNFTQQTDILPTVLKYLNYKSPYFGFGASRFSDEKSGFSVQYMNGVYQFISEGYVLQFSSEKTIGLYNIKNDKAFKNDLTALEPEITARLERKLKAVIQQYNNRVINNQLTE
ncbi:MAG: sulfatase-like hydrolase/transferase [Salibacteraceae bacterium]|nr:sulfatase-like hydrolase/transferase [Salibacteraceae bacterium]|tara:strand:- start:27975 stop:29855 length:1881 start_codon:yes stop_codon:yes gene_type:complete